MKVSYNAESKTLTVPETEGVQYLIDGKKVKAGEHVLDKDVAVTAEPLEGYVFPDGANTERKITVAPASAEVPRTYNPQHQGQ